MAIIPLKRVTTLEATEEKSLLTFVWDVFFPSSNLRSLYILNISSLPDRWFTNTLCQFMYCLVCINVAMVKPHRSFHMSGKVCIMPSFWNDSVGKYSVYDWTKTRIHANGQEVYKNELNTNILGNSTQVQNKNLSPHNYFYNYYKKTQINSKCW